MPRHRVHPVFSSAALCTCPAVCLFGCNPGPDCPPPVLSAADTARLDAEVRQALEDSSAATVAGDWEKMEAFWGDFDDFIHAGDGRVLKRPPRESPEPRGPGRAG